MATPSHLFPIKHVWCGSADHSLFIGFFFTGISRLCCKFYIHTNIYSEASAGLSATASVPAQKASFVHYKHRTRTRGVGAGHRVKIRQQQSPQCCILHSSVLAEQFHGCNKIAVTYRHFSSKQQQQQQQQTWKEVSKQWLALAFEPKRNWL